MEGTAIFQEREQGSLELIVSIALRLDGPTEVPDVFAEVFPSSLGGGVRSTNPIFDDACKSNELVERLRFRSGSSFLLFR